MAQTRYAANPDAAQLKEKQRYVQGYLQVVSNLYGRGHFSREQARIAEIAWRRRLPPSGFVSLIRREDPAYPGTDDFKLRHSVAREAWAKHNPDRPMPHEFATNYVRSGLSRTQLLSRMEQGMGKQPTVTPPTHPAAYRRLRSLLNESFTRTTGQPAPERLHRMIFSADVGDDDIDVGFPDLFGGKESFAWLEPPKPSSAMLGGMAVSGLPELPGIDAK